MRTAFLIVCICMSLKLFGQSSAPNDSIIINSQITISTESCEETLRLLIGEQMKPVEICKCIYPKLYEDFRTDSIYSEMLKEDFSILLELSKEPITKHIGVCIAEIFKGDSLSKITFTPLTEAGLRMTWTGILQGSDSDKTIDTGIYCDCMIAQLQNDFTIKEYFVPDITETDKYKKIEKKCMKRAGKAK